MGVAYAFMGIALVAGWLAADFIFWLRCKGNGRDQWQADPTAHATPALLCIHLNRLGNGFPHVCAEFGREEGAARRAKRCVEERRLYPIMCNVADSGQYQNH